MMPEGTTGFGRASCNGAYVYTLIFVTVPFMVSVFNEYALDSQYDTSIYLQSTHAEAEKRKKAENAHSARERKWLFCTKKLRKSSDSVRVWWTRKSLRLADALRLEVLTSGLLYSCYF